MEIIKAFLNKVNQDATLRASYSSTKDLGELSEFAAGLGYKITPAEFQDYFKTTDAGLEDLTGGTSMMGSTKTGGEHGGWYSGD